LFFRHGPLTLRSRFLHVLPFFYRSGTGTILLRGSAGVPAFLLFSGCYRRFSRLQNINIWLDGRWDAWLTAWAGGWWFALPRAIPATYGMVTNLLGIPSILPLFLVCCLQVPSALPSSAIATSCRATASGNRYLPAAGTAVWLYHMPRFPSFFSLRPLFCLVAVC
jgi:hypothetical protein